MHPLFLMSIISQAELPASVHSVGGKSTLQSLEMKKGISFFAKNFYIILDKSLNSLESFHTGAC
jgi:hypothetical protein